MRLLRTTLLAVCVVASALAQSPSVLSKDNSPTAAVTTLTFLDGSNNPQYICKAYSSQPEKYVWAVTPLSNQGTLTSIVVATNGGTVTVTSNHGLAAGNLVVVSGSTTAALNKAYMIQTVGSATTFTITTSGVSDGTYNTANLAIGTNAPRTAAPVWSIERWSYTSNVPTSDQWAAAVSTGGGGTTAKAFICDNRATIAFQ